MSKTIWVINQYGSTPATGMGGRHYYLASELAKQGYSVYVVASAANHLLREPPLFEALFKMEKVNGFTMVWVNMPSYSQAHSKQRAIGWLRFAWRLRKLARVIPDQPNAILCSSPSVFSFLGAQRLAQRFKARLVFEVRDIWPLTLTEIGGHSPKNPFIRLMQWVEDKAYRDSDRVVSNLKNSVEHMVQHGLSREKFVWIPNGFSQEEVNLKTPLNETTASQLPKRKFLIGYTGTVGIANTMDTLIDAAERVKDYSDIVFVIVGDGKEKPQLRKKVEEKKLMNVIFVDPIPKVEIQAMLNRFDSCFIGWLNDPLYRFGIGANKIPEYLYSGKPVIHSYSGANDPIQEVQAGLQVEAENPTHLAEAIIKLYQMPIEERQAMGARGHQAAVQQYEYAELANQLAHVLFDD